MIAAKIIVCTIFAGIVGAIFVVARRVGKDVRQESEKKREERMRTHTATEPCHFCGGPRCADEFWVQSMYGDHKVFHDVTVTRHLWTNVSVKIPCCPQCSEEFTRQNGMWTMKRLLVTVVWAVFIAACAFALGFVLPSASEDRRIDRAIAFACLFGCLSLIIVWRMAKRLRRPDLHEKMCAYPAVALLRMKRYKWGRSPGEKVTK